MNTCPNCGYCPHCGRRNAAPNWPYAQPYYPQPIWIGTPYMTGTTVQPQFQQPQFQGGQTGNSQGAIQ